jgi:hypothetical protein
LVFGFGFWNIYMDKEMIDNMASSPVFDPFVARKSLETECSGIASWTRNTRFPRRYLEPDDIGGGFAEEGRVPVDHGEERRDGQTGNPLSLREGGEVTLLWRIIIETRASMIIKA